MGNDIRYEIILYWSERDQAFIAEVPELPGCAADGRRTGRLWRMSRSSFRNGLRQHARSAVRWPEPRGRLMYGLTP